MTSAPPLDSEKPRLAPCVVCGRLWLGAGWHSTQVRMAPCGHFRTYDCTDLPVGDCRECEEERGSDALNGKW